MTFDLETGAHIARRVGNLPTNFGVSMTFRSRLSDKHLSDASHDLATLTFDLRGYDGLSCSIYVSSLKFVGLPIRKILRIYYVSINRHSDLDL